MSRQIFVNLPVADLDKTVAFFTALGFTFNPQFTDEKATCMVIGDEAYAMFLVRDFFGTFATKPVADTSTTEVTVAISAESREDVDTLVSAALSAGGSPAGDTIDDGPMYGGSFLDIDGHHWEVIYMDPSALQAG